MEQQQGFSLLEVLLSLMLMASIALALLQQQGSTGQYFNQLLHKIHAEDSLLNAAERRGIQGI